MPISLGSVQLKIMRVLWDEGEATARRITDVLGQSTPIAHSTVQTLLRKLEAKGAVAHEQSDRTFLFRPLIAESEASRSAAQDLLSRVFQGSISGLVAHLLDSDDVSPEEMKRLRALVEAKSKEVQR
ncbi:MAG TPA: BlaI/MecI/CopY family transcriptional regulator [Fimbriimonadaceae bacterium]|nr:BlaI/MecI/CopY family transcriptional regulator [Fimbriimonadaceae bacterium]